MVNAMVTVVRSRPGMPPCLFIGSKSGHNYLAWIWSKFEGQEGFDTLKTKHMKRT